MKSDLILIDMNIGETIRKLRKVKGMTQVKLAEKVGTTQKVIADYELGGSKPPIDKLPAIASALEVSLDELLGIREMSEPERPIQKIHGNSRTAKVLEVYEKLPENDQRSILKQMKGILGKVNT